MDEVLATLAQVPRKTREKEAGAGGVTTQADRVQQCTAQGSSGKVGGAPWAMRIALLRLGAPADALFSSCVFLSLFAPLVLSQVTY